MLSPVMNKSLYAMLMKITPGKVYHCCCHHCWKTPLTLSLCSHPLFDLHKCSAVTSECQCYFFLHEGIQWHPFASCTLSCQMPFCQTAPLLPSVMQQQNVREYWWEGTTSTFIPPTSTSHVLNQHQIGGLTSRDALRILEFVCCGLVGFQ